MQAAQLIHAAGESSPGNLPRHTYAIALTARDQEELWDISEKLVMAGIKIKLIIESDAPYEGQLMAIGLFPAKRSILKKYLSSLRLLR